MDEFPRICSKSWRLHLCTQNSVAECIFFVSGTVTCPSSSTSPQPFEPILECHPLKVSSCLHAHLVTRKGFIQRFGKKRKIGMQFWVTGMYNPDYGISFWTMIVGYKCIPPITWDEIGGYDLIITNYPGIYIYRDYLHSISMIFPWII